jgi:CPA1 family monovalent cation:H+ antiporter
VVAGGLYLSSKRYEFLKSSSRVRGINVWGSLIFLLNGIVFVLIGLDLPQIIAGLGNINLSEAIGYGVLITIVVIIIRLLSSYGAVGVTLIMRNFINVADPNPPGKKAPLIIGWTGMRGVVSLAAALSVPVYLENGEAFPQRNLILFITFIVILLTLIVQGLTLPSMIKNANLQELDYSSPEEDVMNYLDKEIHRVALAHIQTKYDDVAQNSKRYQELVSFIQNQLEDETDFHIKAKTAAIYREILELQRNHLIHLNKSKENLDEELIRKKMMILDYQEERLNLKS